jgi:hypothetical protein
MEPSTTRELQSVRQGHIGGALIMVVGVGAIFQASHYRIGNLTHMGSGFFPACLGAALTVLGAIIALTAKRPLRNAVRPVHASIVKPDWRGWFCILSSLVAFIVLSKHAGLIPASFAITFIAALGDRTNTWKSAAVLASLITVIAIVVFWWALQLDLPLFRLG